MAKKKDGSKKKKPSKRPVKKKSPRIAAWQELVAFLKTSKYVQKVQILAQLKSIGYDVTDDSVSYVMTAARKQGNLCVYTGPRTGYTATPSGNEALSDVRKRRRVSLAWLKNAIAEIRYVKANKAKLLPYMTATDAIELDKEIRYHAAAVKSAEGLRRTGGLQ